MEVIDGFSKAEYLITFYSLLFGFIVSEFFEGLGYIVRYQNNIRNKTRFLIFSSVILGLLLVYWWNSWSKSDFITSSILNYLSVLPYAAVFYALSMILFVRINEIDDLEEHLVKSRKAIWLCLSLYFFYDYFNSVLHQVEHFRLLGLLLSLAGYVLKGKRVQNLLIASAAVLLVTYVAFDFYGFFVQKKVSFEYSKEEHLTIFLSFIFGFVVVEFMKGWTLIAQRANAHNISWIHLIWSFFTFLLLVDIWWGNWLLSHYNSQNQLYFQIILFKPFSLYILALFMFPSQDEHITDYWKYFNDQRKSIFLTYGFVLGLNVLISWFFNLYEIEFFENILRVIGILIAIMAYRYSNSKVHIALQVLAFILLLVDLVNKLGVL